MKFKDIYGDELEISANYGKVIFDIKYLEILEDNALHFDVEQALRIMACIELNILKARAQNETNG